MHLSDAMMLGSMTCEIIPGDWNTCALGAAANALGMPREFESKIFGVSFKVYDREKALIERFPWLSIETGSEVVMYDVETNEPLPELFIDSIWFRFDRKVCEGKMTFEQLIDYVRSIEPECGECNYFKCQCNNLKVFTEEAVEETYAAV